MKKMMLAAAAIVGAFVHHGTFAAEGIPFYANIGVGVGFPTQNSSFTNDSSFIFYALTIPNGSDIDFPNVTWENDFKNGFSGNVAIGYQFLPCVRWEAEFLWQNYKRDIGGSFEFQELVAATGEEFDHDFGDVSASISNRANIYALMANAYYDFRFNCRWIPFIGAGIGIARMDSDAKTGEGTLITQPVSGALIITPLLQTSPSLYGYALGWQFKAGLGYALCDNMNLNVQYRLFGTTRFRASDSVFVSNPGTNVSATFSVPGDDVRGMLVNAVELNFRYCFNL